MEQNTSQLIPLAQFERCERSPVNMRWLIFHQKDALQENGAIIRFGTSRWLVDEVRLIEWLREKGESFTALRRTKLKPKS